MGSDRLIGGRTRATKAGAATPVAKVGSDASGRGGATHGYLVAIGANRLARDRKRPEVSVKGAAMLLRAADLDVLAVSRTVRSRPIGPSMRRYANAVAMIRTPLTPPDLLRRLQAIERAHGRVRLGQRWRARPLDLDIIAWSGGVWTTLDLTIPHPQAHRRTFVLGPIIDIARATGQHGLARAARRLLARLHRHPASRLTAPPRVPRCPPSRRASRASARNAPAGPLAQSVEQLTFNQ